MRRDEMVTAFENVKRALTESGVIELLLPTNRETAGRERKPQEALEVFRSYARSAARFSAPEREILEIFNLTALDRTAFWLNVLVGAKDSSRTHEITVAVRQFLIYTPKILKLLENDAGRARVALNTGTSRDQDLLTAVLIEPHDQISRPERVIDAIRSITTLYEVIATLRSLPTDSLAIIACDSGSDKSFDFLGISEAVRAVKELIVELWDRVVFHRQLRADASATAALRSLSVIDEIERLRSEHKIDPEDAERLKHRAISGAAMFLDCGMTIPELDLHTSYNPRALLAPQPKLLSGAVVQNAAKVTSGDADETSPSDDEMPSVLSEDERALLQKLLEKSRREK